MGVEHARPKGRLLSDTRMNPGGAARHDYMGNHASRLRPRTESIPPSAACLFRITTSGFRCVATVISCAMESSRSIVLASAMPSAQPHSGRFPVCFMIRGTPGRSLQPEHGHPRPGAMSNHASPRCTNHLVEISNQGTGRIGDQKTEAANMLGSPSGGRLRGVRSSQKWLRTADQRPGGHAKKRSN